MTTVTSLNFDTLKTVIHHGIVLIKQTFTVKATVVSQHLNSVDKVGTHTATVTNLIGELYSSIIRRVLAKSSLPVDLEEMRLNGTMSHSRQSSLQFPCSAALQENMHVICTKKNYRKSIKREGLVLINTGHTGLEKSSGYSVFTRLKQIIDLLSIQFEFTVLLRETPALSLVLNAGIPRPPVVLIPILVIGTPFNKIQKIKY